MEWAGIGWFAWFVSRSFVYNTFVIEAYPYLGTPFLCYSIYCCVTHSLAYFQLCRIFITCCVVFSVVLMKFRFFKIKFLIS